MADRHGAGGVLEVGPVHLRALLCVAEARYLTGRLAATHGPEYLWPGFDFSLVPLVFFEGSHVTVLAQHPDPPAEFRPLDLPLPGLEGVPLHYHVGELPWLPAAAPVPVGGRVAAVLPFGVFREDAVPEVLVAGLVHEAFHAHERWHGRGAPDLSRLSRYPELSPTNNALGNLEGLILYDFLAPRLTAPAGRSAGAPAEEPGSGPAGDPAETERVAYDFSLIRRERRGPLEDDIIEYESSLERAEGVARYVEVKSLLGAMDGYHPGRAFVTLTGRDHYTHAPDLLRDQLERLRGINLRAAGAAWWRFFLSGMALALFADFADTDWKKKVMAGKPLDAVIEERVVYDGGAGDERAIEALKERYGYDARLDSEREHARQEKKRKQALLATLLRGAGTRITFDLSALITEETWWESGRFVLVWDPATVEVVTQNVRIHRHGLRFAGFGTEVCVTGLPVVEDLKHRLLHVSVPEVGRLSFQGDGRRCAMHRPAWFEEGLELRLPGVLARAKSGLVQNTGETLYIKILR
ncbi:MAG: hypothetical protein K6U08_01180 [Firmicutes bacterium]|nr:hypothetical protein [Bacillota bacterium]